MTQRKQSETTTCSGYLSEVDTHLEAILVNPQLYIVDRGVTIQNLKDLDDKLLHHIKNLSTDADICVKSLGQHCPIDSADDVSDYSYRIQMPINRRAFGFDDQIASLNQSNDIFKTAIKGTHNPALVKIYNDGIQQNLNSIATLQTNYPAALKQATGIKWISSVVQERCRQDPSSSDCLTNAQADAWIAQIIVK